MLSDVSDENNAYMVYFVSFLGTLAVLPGNIVSALLMDKIGRLRMLGNPQSPPVAVATRTNHMRANLFPAVSDDSSGHFEF